MVMTKIAVNTTSANFMLSRAAYNWLIQNRGWRYIGLFDVYKEGTQINSVVNANDDVILLTVTASASTGGTITRRGTVVPLTIGSSVIYDLAPTTGNYAKNIIIDGYDGGSGLSSVTLSSMSDNHIIHVVYDTKPTQSAGEYAIDVYHSIGGNVSHTGRTVTDVDLTVTATPFTGFTYDSIKINGTPVDISALEADDTYTHTFTGLTADARIEILFRPINQLEIPASRVTKLLWSDTGGSWYMNVTDRSDGDLITCLETLTLPTASGSLNVLKIVEIPDNITSWEVEKDCNGDERVVTPYQSWK